MHSLANFPDKRCSWVRIHVGHWGGCIFVLSDVYLWKISIKKIWSAYKKNLWKNHGGVAREIVVDFLEFLKHLWRMSFRDFWWNLWRTSRSLAGEIFRRIPGRIFEIIRRKKLVYLNEEIWWSLWSNFLSIFFYECQDNSRRNSSKNSWNNQ